MKRNKLIQRFPREVLGVELWSKQAQIFSDLFEHRRVAVRSGHGLGKSFLGANIVLAFIYHFKNSKVITTAPTWRQVEGILWSEVRKLYHNARIPLGGELLQTQLKLDDDWFAIGLSTNQPDRFQGWHAPYLLLLIDEASGVSDEIYDAAISCKPTHIFVIGNPLRKSGFFYDLFARPRPGWRLYHLSCYHSPNVTGERHIPGLVDLEWIEDRKTEWGEDSPLFYSRVLGEFPEIEEDAIFNMRDIDIAVKSKLQLTGQAVIGLDVARYGVDETVWVVRQGRVVLDIVNMKRGSLMAVVGKTVQLVKKYNPEIVIIDDTGLGGGVTDRLNEIGIVSVYPVNFGARAPMRSDIYANMKAYLFFNLQKLFRDQLISIPDHPVLREQLLQMRYEIKSTGQLKVIDPDKSPDYADALALAFYPHVGPQIIVF